MKDAQLGSRTAREKLKVQGKPYYREIGGGLHLGYRKGKTGGRWVARLYRGERDYQVETFADADDKLDANGKTVLTFNQAQDRARELHAKLHAPAEPAAPVTVGQVVKDYVAMRDARDNRRQGREVRSDAARRLGRYVLGQDKRGKQEGVPAAPLAGVAMTALSEDDLVKWRAGLPSALKETTKRRLVNDLKAALNSRAKLLPASLAIGSGLKGDAADDAEPVARDNQILSDAQLMRLLVATRQVDADLGYDGDLFRLVAVLSATGARFSQIVRMKVRDCQLDKARLLVPSSRKGRGGGKSGAITIPVEPAVVDLLRPVVTGRSSDASLLERWNHRRISGAIRWERTTRGPWQTASDLARPWKAIRARAEMPGVIAYALRHSSIVRGIRQNLPIRLVAAAHDTSVAMIEKHYAKWITSGLEEMARAAIVPLLPPVESGKVVQIGTR
ncbi:integrase [Mesorhizobium sp. M2E.F.Ca.ET.166.01.1.1]|uniref:integrase n=1 Tax=unclassified Mesorhizobium TaxID=325217 RepID=UPI0032B13724